MSNIFRIFATDFEEKWDARGAREETQGTWEIINKQQNNNIMKKLFALVAVLALVASASANVLWEETFDKNGSSFVEKDANNHWPYAGGDASKNYVFTNYSTDYKEVTSYNVSVRSKKFVGAEQGTPGFYIGAGKAADQCFVKLVYDFVKDGGTMYFIFEVCSDQADGGDLSKMTIKANGKEVEIPATTLGNKLVPVTVNVPLEAGDVTSLEIICDNLPAQLFVSHPRIASEMGEAIENVFAGKKVTKTIEDGQIVMIIDGVRYNAMGAKL